MRPPEAKPRSRASTVTTLSGRARTQPSRRVPTIGFDLLYVLVIVRLARRDLVWINVTTNPTAEWIARQVTEAFPWNEAPRYLIRDRDCDKRIASGSPWQNGFAEG
jgi:hypothetical protein